MGYKTTNVKKCEDLQKEGFLVIAITRGEKETDPLTYEFNFNEAEIVIPNTPDTSTEVKKPKKDGGSKK